jgi:hypothetical protein
MVHSLSGKQQTDSQAADEKLMHIRNKRRNNTLYISKISYEKTGFRLVD